MKLVSWNVNGIRSVLKKGFLQFIERHQPDILCIQETKARLEQADTLSEWRHETDYEIYWNPASRAGYAGTAIVSRVKPQGVRFGIGIPEHDQEGRVITLELPEYFLVNVYTPNAGEELKRLPYRLRWDGDFRNYAKGLEKKKPVIVCGDLNVAHKEIDLANPAQNRRHSGFTDEERAGFSAFLEAGFLDTFRVVNSEPHQYTWWTYRFGARKRNIGWRIDYFCISKDLRPLMKEASIRPEVMGSDHCPVELLLK